MKKSRRLLAALILAAPLAGCGADKNSACEPCANTDDCETGLTCQLFEDPAGATRNLCGDTSPNMVCPSR